MTTYDPELAEIIKNNTPVEINNRLYTVEPARGGSCEGCYFDGKMKCYPKAVTFCTSNGGNILKLVEPSK